MYIHLLVIANCSLHVVDISILANLANGQLSNCNWALPSSVSASLVSMLSGYSTPAHMVDASEFICSTYIVLYKILSV